MSIWPFKASVEGWSSLQTVSNDMDLERWWLSKDGMVSLMKLGNYLVWKPIIWATTKTTENHIKDFQIWQSCCLNYQPNCLTDSCGRHMILKFRCTPIWCHHRTSTCGGIFWECLNMEVYFRFFCIYCCKGSIAFSSTTLAECGLEIIWASMDCHVLNFKFSEAPDYIRQKQDNT